MIAVPFASPLGISPTGLWVNRSSSCACDIFNISATVSAMFSDFVIGPHLQGFEILDQRALIGVWQIRAEIVSLVLDEVGTLVGCNEIGNNFAPLCSGGF